MSPDKATSRDRMHLMAGLDVVIEGWVLRFLGRYQVGVRSISRSVSKDRCCQPLWRSVSSQIFSLCRRYLTRLVAVRHIRELWYFGVSEVRDNSFLANRLSDVLSALQFAGAVPRIRGLMSCMA